MLTLDRLLDGLHVEVRPFALCEVHGHGRLDMGRQAEATIHYTLAGCGRFHIAGHAPQPVRAGSVLILPAVLPHRLQALGDGPGSRPLPRCAGMPADWQRHLAGADGTDGDDGGGVLVACAELDARFGQVQGLFSHLAAPLAVHAAPDDAIARTLTALLAELARPAPGSAAMARALMQQCLIHVLRQVCQGNADDGRSDGTCRLPWLAALQDERLGRAVDAVAADPAAPHNLDSLAALAGMSRSSFAAHFTQAFGRGPMAYVGEVRLQAAAAELRHGDRPVKELAAKVGYDSRSYFSRAFRARYGCSPAAYRAAARGEAAGEAEAETKA